jgi:hypothetical protein
MVKLRCWLLSSMPRRATGDGCPIFFRDEFLRRS